MAYTTAPDTVNARVDFAYDAYGRRVLETVTGGDGSTWWKRQYIWDGWRLLQERNALTGAVLADYYYGPNYVDELLLCRRDLDGNGSYAADGSEDFYYLTDHQYSTLAVVDGTGTIVERYSYTPFGEASYYDGAGAPIGGSAIGNRFLFTGRERHEILPLYDYRNRMYDPGSGRFLSPDPVYDPANLGNVYTYLNNNPLSTLDPYGEWGIKFGQNGPNIGYGEPTLQFDGSLFAFTQGDYENMEELVSFVPVVGWAADADILRRELGRGQYVSATFTAIGFVPLVGDAATGIFRAADKGFDGVRSVVKSGSDAVAVAEAEAAAGQAAIRSRVLANIEASKEARRVSQFDVHLAAEDIYANANKAVSVAKEAGLTNKNGALGMIAHGEFARLNAATSKRLAGRGIDIKIEP